MARLLETFPIRMLSQNARLTVVEGCWDETNLERSNPSCRITKGGRRRIDVLELLRIVEALKGDPRRVFADILTRPAP
jgi:hypothetical protein